MLSLIINQVIKNKSEKPIILVIKGFERCEFPPIEFRLFNNWDDSCIDIDNVKDFKTEILPQLFNAISREVPYFWITIEEYFLSKEFIGINFDIRVITNNLYYQRFPYQNTLKDISQVYDTFYRNPEDIVPDNKRELFEIISSFYGDIYYSRTNSKFYVTYRELEIEPTNIYELYNINQYNITFDNDTIKINDVIEVELIDDETPFLDLINILSNRYEFLGIKFVVTSDISILPNDYRRRIEILSRIYPEINISFTTKSIEKKIIPNILEYMKILKKYWEYNDFRELRMYSNIENRRKETIIISQAQIINDIVEQALAAINQQDYRDIYITSSTGSGKSVMFQIPSLYLTQILPEVNPLTLVISPLIGLMNDQVSSLKVLGINTVRTIHSNTLPFERETTLQEIANGKVNMLYLSPETLQSKSDIKALIGERKISLLIIDEAHIVTTWGKTFRADYWYLGIYLQKIRKEYSFPIVTFTATAIYGGKEDMYLDTRDSLNLINPIAYFGYVKREDIFMHVQSSEHEFNAAGKDYRSTKNILTYKNLLAAHIKKEKVLVYFPTIKLLTGFFTFLKMENQDIYKFTGTYYGTMEKEAKDEVLNSYKNGELRYVLATKAFGMGIDIPDIVNVYHYTPTGTVTDYIQEIGRVARDKGLVKYGHAWFDFLRNDFVEVKKLYGMSAVKKNQILEVINKILSVYEEKGYNRNLIVNADDFRYIFREDFEDIDNKLKTILLMIEKDFASPENIGYSPFVARPKSMYGNELIQVDREFERTIKASTLNQFFTYIGQYTGSINAKVFRVDLSGIWEKYYKEISFQYFKYRIFAKNDVTNMKYGSLLSQFTFVTGLTVPQKSKVEIAELQASFEKIITAFRSFANNVKRKETFFTIRELGDDLQKRLRIHDKFIARTYAQSLVNACFEFCKIRKYKLINERTTLNESLFQFTGNYDMFFGFLSRRIEVIYANSNRRMVIDKTITNFYYRSNINEAFDLDLLVLGLTETFNLLSYEVIGGNNPQIFIRMNSVYPLQRALKQGNTYRNRLLESIQFKHRISIAMLTYLFKYKPKGEKQSDKVRNYTEFFWEKIEDYFLGIIPDEVEKEIYSSRVVEVDS